MWLYNFHLIDVIHIFLLEEEINLTCHLKQCLKCRGHSYWLLSILYMNEWKSQERNKYVSGFIIFFLIPVSWLDLLILFHELFSFFFFFIYKRLKSLSCKDVLKLYFIPIFHSINNIKENNSKENLKKKLYPLCIYFLYLW